MLFESNDCLFLTIALSESNNTLGKIITMINTNFINNLFIEANFLYQDRISIHWESLYLKYLEENTWLQLWSDHMTYYDIEINIIAFHR